MGEGGAHAPKEGRKKTVNKRYISDNQNTNLLKLFNPLLFQVVVDPSLSPFIPTITIAFGGRHLSRMQPFSLIPNLYRARTFFIFVSMTAPSGKAVTSSVGNADTFPEREGILPREINIISEKIAEIFIQFKIVRIYIIILLLLLFLPFSIDLKSENMYNNIDITL